MSAERVGFWQMTEDETAALLAHARAHPMRLTTDERFDALEDAMRSRLAARGPRTKFMTVLLGAGTEQGDAIDEHQHPEHTLLWYAQNTALLVRGEEVKVSRGEIIHLAPGTPHAVPKVSAPRLAVAMLVPVKP